MYWQIDMDALSPPPYKCLPIVLAACLFLLCLSLPLLLLQLRPRDQEGVLADRHGRRHGFGRVGDHGEERHPRLGHLAPRRALGGRQGHCQQSGGCLFFCLVLSCLVCCSWFFFRFFSLFLLLLVVCMCVCVICSFRCFPFVMFFLFHCFVFGSHCFLCSWFFYYYDHDLSFNYVFLLL